MAYLKRIWSQLHQRPITNQLDQALDCDSTYFDLVSQNCVHAGQSHRWFKFISSIVKIFLYRMELVVLSQNKNEE
jgi:hypothetical protein